MKTFMGYLVIGLWVATFVIPVDETTLMRVVLTDLFWPVVLCRELYRGFKNGTVKKFAEEVKEEHREGREKDDEGDAF